MKLRTPQAHPSTALGSPPTNVGSGGAWNRRGARPGSAASRTLLVAGVAGSGTSMITTVLDRLGVRADLEIVEALDGPGATFRDLDPAGVDALRDLHVLVAFRDPVALAERGPRSGPEDFVDRLRVAARGARHLVRWTAMLRCPVLVISYERAVDSPEWLVETVISFCGLEPTSTQRGEAVAAVLDRRR